MTKHVAMFLGEHPQPFAPEVMLRVCTSLVWDQRYAEAEAVLDFMLEHFTHLHSTRAERCFGELLGMRSMLMAFVDSAEHRSREREVRRAPAWSPPEQRNVRYPGVRGMRAEKRRR